MTLSRPIAILVLAVLEGGLVALPRGDALRRLGRLRSPLWAASLPGLIVAGTFGVLLLPSIALGLVVLAAVATPVLATVAVLGVVRGRVAFVGLIPLAAAILACRARGLLGQGSDSLLTALGCLSLGTALVRLIPSRLIPVAVLAMCAIDVALLAVGVGEPAVAAMNRATAQFHGPAFDHATIGPITTDYPDLVLAAALGAMMSAQVAAQRLAAVLVAALVAAYGLLLLFVSMLPATVPIALAYVLLHAGGRARRWRLEPAGAGALLQRLPARPVRALH
ncbi:MAG: hypothetical protein ABSG43_00730 [Solirubrobacteraceae bacterium]|jgi:hypothetical protein